MPTTHGHALLWLPGWRNGVAWPRESMQRPTALYPPAPSQVCFTSRLPRGYCQPLLLGPCPKLKPQPLLKEGRAQHLLGVRGLKPLMYT